MTGFEGEGTAGVGNGFEGPGFEVRITLGSPESLVVLSDGLSDSDRVVWETTATEEVRQ